VRYRQIVGVSRQTDATRIQNNLSAREANQTWDVRMAAQNHRMPDIANQPDNLFLGLQQVMPRRHVFEKICFIAGWRPSKFTGQRVHDPGLIGADFCLRVEPSRCVSNATDKV